MFFAYFYFQARKWFKKCHIALKAEQPNDWPSRNFPVKWIYIFEYFQMVCSTYIGSSIVKNTNIKTMF